MSIKAYDVKTADYNIVYYSSCAINKIKSFITYSTGGTFEANKVMENIYLGGINSVYDKDELKKLGVKNIVSVIAGFEPPYSDDFNYIVLNALDTVNTDLKEFFSVTNDFIDESLDNSQKILIHCMAGRSRSVTILAAYIIKTYGMDVTNTLNTIKAARFDIEPNEYFISQLEKYYKELYL